MIGIKNYKLAYLLILLSLGFSCGNGNVQQQNQSDNEKIVQNNNTSSEDDWLIVKMAGNEIGKISKNTDEICFFVQGTEYQSRLKGDKRKYAVKSGDIIVEVKYKDDGFKVRRPDGSLLWKIKLYDDKVKISDNEENQNPYEIKTGDSGKIKLKRNDETIGEVEFKASDNKIEITAGPKSYYIESSKPSLAYGVLIIDEIPEYIRYLIAAELLAKGK